MGKTVFFECLNRFSEQIVRPDLQEQAELVHDERGPIRQDEESGGLEEHPFPRVELPADDRERGEAWDGEQAEQHHAEPLQRSIGAAKLLAKRFLFVHLVTGGFGVLGVQDAELGNEYLLRGQGADRGGRDAPETVYSAASA